MGIADPLRTEHAQLLPQLEALPATAIATEGSEDEVLAALDAALAFLHDSLIYGLDLSRTIEWIRARKREPENSSWLIEQPL
jgi:hypothetical protein